MANVFQASMDKRLHGTSAWRLELAMRKILEE
jgi:hypothetical protein